MVSWQGSDAGGQTCGVKLNANCNKQLFFGKKRRVFLRMDMPERRFRKMKAIAISIFEGLLRKDCAHSRILHSLTMRETQKEFSSPKFVSNRDIFG